MQKDSTNHVGFSFKDGEVVAIVKDSSAARNGLLTDHFLTEVNGQNVIGLKVGITLLFVHFHMYTNAFHFQYTVNGVVLLFL